MRQFWRKYFDPYLEKYKTLKIIPEGKSWGGGGEKPRNVSDITDPLSLLTNPLLHFKLPFY